MLCYFTFDYFIRFLAYYYGYLYPDHNWDSYVHVYNLHIVVSHFIGKDLQLHFPSLRGLYFLGRSKPSGSFKGGEMGQGLTLSQ